jgi:hypothetical protein
MRARSVDSAPNGTIPVIRGPGLEEAARSASISPAALFQVAFSAQSLLSHYRRMTYLLTQPFLILLI